MWPDVALDLASLAPRQARRILVSNANVRMIRSRFTDDLDGSAAEGTVRFGLDGTGYEIDLNAGHARELQGCAGRVPADLVAKFTAATSQQD